MITVCTPFRRFETTELQAEMQKMSALGGLMDNNKNRIVMLGVWWKLLQLLLSDSCLCIVLIQARTEGAADVMQYGEKTSGTCFTFGIVQYEAKCVIVPYYKDHSAMCLFPVWLLFLHTVHSGTPKLRT